MCERRRLTPEEISDIKSRWTYDPELDEKKAPFLDHMDKEHQDVPIENFGGYMIVVREHRAAHERGELSIEDLK